MFTFIQPGITCSCKAAIAIPRLYFCGFCRFHQHILSRLVESLSTDVSYSASTSAISQHLRLWLKSQWKMLIKYSCDFIFLKEFFLARLQAYLSLGKAEIPPGWETLVGMLVLTKTFLQCCLLSQSSALRMAAYFQNCMCLIPNMRLIMKAKIDRTPKTMTPFW